MSTHRGYSIREQFAVSCENKDMGAKYKVLESLGNLGKITQYLFVLKGLWFSFNLHHLFWVNKNFNRNSMIHAQRRTSALLAKCAEEFIGCTEEAGMPEFIGAARNVSRQNACQLLWL